MNSRISLQLGVVLFLLLAAGLVSGLLPDPKGEETPEALAAGSSCSALPSHADLKAVLQMVVDAGGNGGLGNDMWATLVNRDGEVCAVAFSGDDRGDQWPGSRVISSQKANTANAFSLPDPSIGLVSGLALSTANLYSAVQPGGSLFGLQHSNPVDTRAAYGGNSSKYGQPNDPMVGEKIGGVNVFGGGLALYDEEGNVLGALGVSGDTSCTDHVVAWKIRDALGLDNVPGGVSPTGDDNMVLDISADANGHPSSAGGFGHPSCDSVGNPSSGIIAALPSDYPTGP